MWTDALVENYRPALTPNDCIGKFFTAVISLAPHGAGTRYSVLVRHGDSEGRQRHAERGFEQGWGAALDQLVAWAKSAQ